MPGLDPEVRFLTFSQQPAINASGRVAFSAFLTGEGVTDTNQTVLLSDFGGSGLEVIARQGAQAPGLPEGVFLDSFVDPLLNDADMLAFVSRHAGEGVASTTTAAIYAMDASGVLQLVAAEEMLFNVSDDPLVDDFRTISELGSFDWNNRNELLFAAGFDDGTSGVFLASVPTPASGVLLVAVGGVVVRRRSRAKCVR